MLIVIVGGGEVVQSKCPTYSTLLYIETKKAEAMVRHFGGRVEALPTSNSAWQL